jgi:DNA-binding transcriptional regulator YiaG
MIRAYRQELEIEIRRRRTRRRDKNEETPMDKLVDGKTGQGIKDGPDRTRPRTRRSGSGHLSPAGAKIVSAFEEAIDVMRSGKPLRGRLTARTHHAGFACPVYGPEDVRRVRSALAMSQVVFAQFLGVNPNTVRSWEQGTRPPSTIARRFMIEIEADSAYWRRRIARKFAKTASQ